MTCVAALMSVFAYKELHLFSPCLAKFLWQTNTVGSLTIYLSFKCVNTTQKRQLGVLNAYNLAEDEAVTVDDQTD